MTLHIEPELNVPVLDDNPFADLTVSIGSAANTALFLAEHGLDIEPTKEDKDIAAALAVEFGQSVVDSATQIRHLVTNKLLLETENSDAKIRIRALELLGKVSDVGLFAEKSEVTITHQSSDDLRAKLRGKLEKLVRPIEDIVDAVVIESDEHTIQEDILDISSEFGSDDPTQYDDD